MDRANDAGEGGGGGGEGQALPSLVEVVETIPDALNAEGRGPHMSVLDERMRRPSEVIPDPQEAGMVEVRRLVARLSCLRAPRVDHCGGSGPDTLLVCRLRKVRAVRELHEGGSRPSSCVPTSLRDNSPGSQRRGSGGAWFAKL